MATRSEAADVKTHGPEMLRKILVANRGEINTRGFRAAREVGAQTLAVRPFEDR